MPASRAGERLDRFLAEAEHSLSRSAVQNLIDQGHVRLNDAPTRASRRVREGDRVEVVRPRHVPSTLEPEAIPLDVVYEDEHLAVVAKPAGMVVHPAAGNRDGTLVNALLHHCGPSLSGIGGVARPGIVHRIDKDTSGLLLVAKSDVAHEGLSSQFADHSIERVYAAIVTGVPTMLTGTINAPLARSETDRKKVAVVKSGGRGKRAVTHWKLRTALRDAALVECRLETGRTHQVRVHLASIGHPLLGDPVYGRSPKQRQRELLARLEFRRQALHAEALGFVHPVTNARLSFASALPSDMQELFSALGV